MNRVLGVDGCKKHWVGVAADVTGLRGYLAPTVAELLSLADQDGQIQCVAVDIPIGLPDAGRRRADLEARKLVGPRRSSVFTTPVRQAVEADRYVDAGAINRQLAGEGISQQAYALRTKLLEVDAFVKSSPRTVIEVHPEVSFATLAGGPLMAPKKSWAGFLSRRSHLARAGFALDDDFGPTGVVAQVDDVLDAAVSAWTARRYLDGVAISLPDPPEIFEDGIRCSIWA